MYGFTPEIIVHIKHYVYRLIDPRNGETFYVGKDHGNRVFAHAKDELGKDQDVDILSDKLKRIRDIRNLGLDVQHVIHRHGLDEKTAFPVFVVSIWHFVPLKLRATASVALQALEIKN